MHTESHSDAIMSKRHCDVIIHCVHVHWLIVFHSVQTSIISDYPYISSGNIFHHFLINYRTEVQPDDPETPSGGTVKCCCGSSTNSTASVDPETHPALEVNICLVFRLKDLT